MPVGWHDAAGEGRKRERGGCSTPIGRQRPSQQRPEAGRRGRHGVAMPHNWPEQGRGGGGEADRWGRVVHCRSVWVRRYSNHFKIV
jgi:hypothetical protein